ncbi:MAG: hypothetical protein AB2705_15970 [Candidatus Thiodiazotropha sp.]
MPGIQRLADADPPLASPFSSPIGGDPIPISGYDQHRDREIGSERC